MMRVKINNFNFNVDLLGSKIWVWPRRPKPDDRINKNRTAENKNQTAEYLLAIVPTQYIMLLDSPLLYTPYYILGVRGRHLFIFGRSVFYLFSRLVNNSAVWFSIYSAVWIRPYVEVRKIWLLFAHTFWQP